MKTLKTLTFAAQPVAPKSPTMVRRAKLVAHLEQQKLLAVDPHYVRKLQKWVAQESGEKQPVEITKRVQPWWRTDEAGNLFLTVRYGAKPLEFEKGKAAILLKDGAKLVATIEMLIAAVRAGELDQQLETHLQSQPLRKMKRAA
jgi:hypothetical protein